MIALSSLVLAAALAADPAASVTSVSYAGSACKEGALDARVVGVGADTLELRFRELVVSEQERSCSVGIQLKLPAGWRVALDMPSATGNARLPAGVTAHLALGWSGLAGKQGQAHWVVPAGDESFLLQAPPSDDAQGASAGCTPGRPELVHVTLRGWLEGGEGELALTQPVKLRLLWERCP